MASKNSTRKKRTKPVKGITSISIQGYKSLAEECTIEIRPLTILAGANSSGKSSALQPILLIKQTLDASYDPGAILLSGPHVKFTRADQLLSRISARPTTDIFTIKIESGDAVSIKNTYKKSVRRRVELTEMVIGDKKSFTTFRPGMTHDEIMKIIPDGLHETRNMLSKEFGKELKWAIERDRGFLRLGLVSNEKKRVFPFMFGPSGVIEREIQRIIHVPGLRGNPERTYPTTAIGDEFPGTFEKYVASVINYWQESGDERSRVLGKAIEELGLTWKVYAEQVDDTQVKLRVGRLPHPIRGGAHDMVSIADVGFGVSQALPVVVALLAAEPGQFVYLEQPEIHLHPRAQISLAKVLADAAIRGVRVVAETHSALLLSAIQAVVAEGYIDPALTKLHWFTRREEDGVTKVDSTDLNRAGAYGDWPEDFGEVDLEAQRRYLNASEQVQLEFAQKG